MIAVAFICVALQLVDDSGKLSVNRRERKGSREDGEEKDMREKKKKCQLRERRCPAMSLFHYLERYPKILTSPSDAIQYPNLNHVERRYTMKSVCLCWNKSSSTSMQLSKGE